MTHSTERNIVILAVIALVALMSVVPTAFAASHNDCATDNCSAVGYIFLTGEYANAAKNTGKAVVHIVNTTNASQEAVSGANGYYNMSFVKNGTNVFVVRSLYSGYNDTTITLAAMAGTDLTGQNFTITAETPTITAETVSAITKNGATMSATLPNTTMGAYLEYSTDSAMVNNVFRLDWSNGTASPSFTLSNLQSSQKIYYRTTAYNRYDENQTDVNAIASFTTLKAGTSSSYVAPTPVPSPRNAIQQLITPKTANDKKKLIFVGMVILAAGVLYYYGMLGGKGGGKGKGKK